MTTPETVTVQLSRPIEHDGKIIESLTFREPELGDMMLSERFDGQLGQIAAVLASVSDTPLPVFKKIKAHDVKRIMSATAGIMGNDIPEATGD